jgi:hypothetical protein
MFSVKFVANIHFLQLQIPLKHNINNTSID